MTLNHPVDCGICDKAGECKLQDYHYAYNGAPSISRRPQGARRPSSIRSPSASCSTTSGASCARAACASRARSRSRTRSASSSAATRRSCAPPTTIRSTPTRIPTTSSTSARSARCCRSRSSTSRASGTSSPRRRSAPGAPAAARSSIWHRKAEWKLHALDPQANARIDRVTPRENPDVNGPWICNKGRDLAADLRAAACAGADAEGQARRSRRGASPRRGA